MRMSVSDEDLALAAAEGDAVAFRTLLEHNYARIFRLSFRLTGEQSLAEDLTQDVCLALPKKLKSFRGEVRFATWLYRVVMNAMIDRKRSDARYAVALEGWGDWEAGRRAVNDQSAAEVAWLYEAMNRLSPSLRETLALILEDLTHAHVARILGVTEGTISWRMSEIRKCLSVIHEEDLA